MLAPARVIAKLPTQFLTPCRMTPCRNDVLTIQETGKGGDAIPDEDVLAYATTEKPVSPSIADTVKRIQARGVPRRRSRPAQ
jgi:hypothetical protein